MGRPKRAAEDGLIYQVLNRANARIRFFGDDGDYEGFEPLTERELDPIRRSVTRGNPYGDPLWSEQMTERLGLETTVRPRGRPRKQRKGS